MKHTKLPKDWKISKEVRSLTNEIIKEIEISIYETVESPLYIGEGDMALISSSVEGLCDSGLETYEIKDIIVDIYNCGFDKGFLEGL